MDRAAFDGLRVIRREWECDTGCSDVCRTSAGEACIRLQIRDGACQREVLSGGAKSAVRLHGGTLEILLPYRDGAPFDKWLERKPSLGQRRDACLDIVAQCIEEKAAPTVIELSAKAENLRFTEHGAGLQLLPDWGAWRRTAVADTATVQAVAALCAELLTSGFSKVQEHLFPVELHLIFARLNSGSYQEWSQLQRDLADIPDDLLPIAHTQRTVLRRAVKTARRFLKPAACVVVAVLLIVALLSLANAYLSWRDRDNNTWGGITIIGDQDLQGE